ncbi:MAG: CbiX/SirB N-terminal domain-containing protein [Betaproteobacteria bacterium]|nr:CbiX/SirB N-terminal domain-containing protein [Betaproteobacteria bacterium]
MTQWSFAAPGRSLAGAKFKDASEVVAFPYFLAAGTHVAQDIPEAIAEFATSHPGIKVRLTQHLGASVTLPAAILGMAA